MIVGGGVGCGIVINFGGRGREWRVDDSVSSQERVRKLRLVYSQPQSLHSPLCALMQQTTSARFMPGTGPGVRNTPLKEADIPSSPLLPRGGAATGWGLPSELWGRVNDTLWVSLLLEGYYS